MIKAIVCCAKDYGIGKANGLLFNIPADMAHFKATTMGKICIFGYSTYQSLKYRPLKGRINVVLWDKAPSLDCLEGAITFSKFDALLNFVKILAKEYDIYVCGGASIYSLFMPYYDEIDITFVDAIDPEATAFFPEIDKNIFEPQSIIPYYINDGLECQMASTNNYSISPQIWARKS